MDFKKTIFQIRKMGKEYNPIREKAIKEASEFLKLLTQILEESSKKQIKICIKDISGEIKIEIAETSFASSVNVYIYDEIIISLATSFNGPIKGWIKNLTDYALKNPTEWNRLMTAVKNFEEIPEEMLVNFEKL